MKISAGWAEHNVGWAKQREAQQMWAWTNPMLGFALLSPTYMSPAHVDPSSG